MKKRYIKEILIFHDFHAESGHLWIAINQIKELSGGYVGNPLSTCTIQSYGLNTSAKIKEALSGYVNHVFKDDLFLILARSADPEANAVVAKTRSGYTIIGPDDGSLGFIPADDLAELRVITEPWCYNEFSRRLFAAAAIVQERPWYEFSKIAEASDLKRRY
ncbi:MAG: hypothetical protein NTX14_02845 [Candidatus Nealsonbacteria bacterium]|nr:hypothetical protein [Candidatus Nealsonbacteria bacterium]